MIPPKLNVVVIGVRDLAAMREFYTRLGWRAKPRDGMFAHFSLDGANLVLFPMNKLEKLVDAPDKRGTGFGGITPAMMLENAAAIDVALAEAVEAGAKVAANPADRPWGVRTAYFADPEGNLWELACPGEPNAGRDS